MKKDASDYELGLFFDRDILFFEGVSVDAVDGVRVVFKEDPEVFFMGSFKNLWDLMDRYFGIDIKGRIEKAAEILHGDKMLPFYVSPNLSLVVFQRVKGLVYVNRFLIN